MGAQEPAPSRALSSLPPGRPSCCHYQRSPWQLSLSADDSGEDDEETTSPPDKSELQGTVKNLSLKLDDLSTCHDLLAKHGAALQRSLNELDSLRLPYDSSEKLKAVNERATLFRITSNAMVNVSHSWRGAPPKGRRFPELVPSCTLNPFLSPHPRRGRWARTSFLTVWGWVRKGKPHRGGGPGPGNTGPAWCLGEP